jgi:hypothetical protein
MDLTLLPSVATSTFSSDLTAGVSSVIGNMWPILLVLVVLALAFPIIKKIIGVIKHAVK